MIKSHGGQGGAMGLTLMGLLVAGAPVSAQSLTTSPGHILLIALQALNSQGQPISGATVEVFAMMPTLSSRRPLIVGTTDANGRVALAMPLTAAVEKAATGNNGNVNLTLIVSRPNSTSLPETWSFTRNIDANTHGGSLGPPSIQLLPHGVTHAWSGGAMYMQSTAGRSSLTKSSVAVPASCGWYPTAVSSSAALTKVGALHNMTDTSASFTYGQTADSTMEVGYSLNGTTNWSADGTALISNNYGTQFKYPVSTGQWADTGYSMESNFTYTKYEWYNPCYPTDRYYTVSATQWDGELLVGTQETGWDNRLVSWMDWVPNGETVTKDYSTAYNYGGAANVFGASLSAHSGFSVNVQEAWTVAPNAPNNQQRGLYGWNQSITSSSRVFAYH